MRSLASKVPITGEPSRSLTRMTGAPDSMRSFNESVSDDKRGVAGTMYLGSSLNSGVDVNKSEIFGIGQLIDLDCLPISASKPWVWICPDGRVVDQILNSQLRD